MRNKEKKIQDIKIIETTEDYERGEIIIAYSFNGGIGLREDKIFTRIIYYLSNKSQSSILTEQSLP